MKRSLFIISLLVFCVLSFGQKEEKIMHALRTNNLEEFTQNFEEDYLYRPLGKDSLQSLAYAAFFKSNKIASWLIDRGADVNAFSGGLTPSMWAARAGNHVGLELFIDNHAGINFTDREGNTALIYASASGCFECVNILVKSGADLQARNHYGYDAEFYAIRSQHRDIRDLLRVYRLESGMQGKELHDGPHVEWLANDKISIVYFKRKSNKNKVKIITRTRKVEELPYRFSGLNRDPGKYIIRKKYSPQMATYTGIDSVFVMGDLHGNYFETLKVLVNSGIVNSNLEWTWGNGHLIFIGDIFDRGNEVTELLWLIKSLQFQALDRGGRVHLLLGNHEVMNLASDTRYISDKYFYLAMKTGLNYTRLFGSTFELGRWLRSLNTMVKVNDILFVHAGISEKMLQEKLSIQDVNDAMRRYLSTLNSEDSLGLLLAGESGPLWFRGYLNNTGDQKADVENSFTKALEFYDVGKMVVGHTPSEVFKLDFDNRLLYIDVSTAGALNNEKALFIKKGRYYKVFADGSFKTLFE
jgi:hypothetical protein